MFAVVMGLAAFAPAALAKGPQPHDKQLLCHFESDPDDNPETEDAVWEVINPNRHAVQKHIDNHGDIPITDDFTEDACLMQNDPA